MHQVNRRNRVVSVFFLWKKKIAKEAIFWPWRNSWKCKNYKNVRITAFPEMTASYGETGISHQKNWCQKILPWVEMAQESLCLCWQLVVLNSAHFSSKSRKAELIQPHISFKILDFRIDTGVKRSLWKMFLDGTANLKVFRSLQPSGTDSSCPVANQLSNSQLVWLQLEHPLEIIPCRAQCQNEHYSEHWNTY